MMGPVLLVMLFLLSLEPTNAKGFPHINTVAPQEDVTVNVSTTSDRRKRSANGFPQDFDVRFTSNHVHSDLKLSINDVSDDVPVAIQRAGKMVSYRVSSEAAAFYMDVSNKAAFIFGTYQSGDRELLVQPPTSADAGHSVTEIEETSPTETDFLINPEFDASKVEQMVASNATDSDRGKRQATAYEVEIFFVIDYSLYSFWYTKMTGTDSEKQTSAISTIKQFYAFVLNASSSDAPYIENNLQSFSFEGRPAFLADTVLTAFRDWGNINLKPQYNFDIAMMFTSTDAYVMAPSSGVSSDDIKNLRQFSFSSCSIDYFTAYITTLNNGENCLATRTANYDTSDLDPYLGDLAGQVYTPDQQCEYLEGEGSYLSRISYDSDYSGICSRMNCFVPGTTSTYGYKLAWEGTTCGDGKLCSGGLCVASSSAPAVANETCMFGNNPSIVTFETVTCSELLAFPNTSYECYNSNTREDCCETCEQIRLANLLQIFRFRMGNRVINISTRNLRWNDLDHCGCDMQLSLSFNHKYFHLRNASRIPDTEVKEKNLLTGIAPYGNVPNWRDQAHGYRPYMPEVRLGTKHLRRSYESKSGKSRDSHISDHVVKVDLPRSLTKSYDNSAFEYERTLEKSYLNSAN
ncbi:hypothetical protein MAR_023665 [Mya arenaria]|uniref:ADAMTS cysteine-rich domain-containing protein n=1 Tax=Mya arenaria TaxID=6604 RepID=A0ABY7DNM4_MYAAR|nr:hypothetical protein MAR_023665 [Mya arenaria]